MGENPDAPSEQAAEDEQVQEPMDQGNAGTESGEAIVIGANGRIENGPDAAMDDVINKMERQKRKNGNTRSMPAQKLDVDPTVGSNPGWAPITYEVSPRALPEQEAKRHLANPKPRDRFGELHSVWDQQELCIAEHADNEIMSLVKRLGGTSATHRRERIGALNRIVTELYSPPRVGAAAGLLPSLKVILGFAFDLTTTNDKGEPWDFSDASMRREAWAMVTTQRPGLVVGSPPCRPDSAWQRINNEKRDPAVVRREQIEGRVHFEFCMRIYRW